MVASSCVTTIMILNYHHRMADTHEMPDWVAVVFLQVRIQCSVQKYILQNIKDLNSEYNNYFMCTNIIIFYYYLIFPVAAVADEDGAARGEDHAEDNHDGEEDEGA